MIVIHPKQQSLHNTHMYRYVNTIESGPGMARLSFPRAVYTDDQAGCGLVVIRGGRAPTNSQQERKCNAHAGSIPCFPPFHAARNSRTSKTKDTEDKKKKKKKRKEKSRASGGAKAHSQSIRPKPTSDKLVGYYFICTLHTLHRNSKTHPTARSPCRVVRGCAGSRREWFFLY